MDMKKTRSKAKPKRSEGPDRSKAKRWCFTINNPTVDDVLDPDSVDYCIVGDETGEEGTRHYQGYAIFKDYQRMSSLKEILPRAHWTKADGTPEQNRRYCSKGEQPKEEWDRLKEKGPNFGLNAQVAEFGEIPKRGGKAEGKKNEICKMAMDSETVHEGMVILKRELPYDFLRFGESMERNLKRSKSETFVPTHEIASFNRVGLVFERKAVLLWGPSNTGKTSYALAHFKKPLLVSHVDVLKTLSPDNDGIVFDDMSFRHWPVEAVIHLLDYDLPRDINVRYGTVNIPKEIQKVFTHNTENPWLYR